MKHVILVREDAPDRFVAHPAGIPELHAEAESQQAAVDQVRWKLAAWLQNGQIQVVDVPEPGPKPHLGGYYDPNDPMEQEYIREIARGRQELDELEAVAQVEESRRARREELKGTIWDYEIPCPRTSSTPTS